MMHLISVLWVFPCDALKGSLNNFGATCVMQIQMSGYLWHQEKWCGECGVTGFVVFFNNKRYIKCCFSVLIKVIDCH